MDMHVKESCYYFFVSVCFVFVLFNFVLFLGVCVFVLLFCFIFLFCLFGLFCVLLLLLKRKLCYGDPHHRELQLILFFCLRLILLCFFLFWLNAKKLTSLAVQCFLN